MSGTQACFRAFLGHGAHATPRLWADFQAFLGSLWHMECWPWQGRRLFFRHTKDIFRTRSRYGKDVTRFSGISRIYLGGVLALAGMQPDFQAFLGNFCDMVCRLCPGCVMATEGTWPDF
ncbi:Hypothetical predicted protein [Olea europaea subsp. europaea]|uniref:Uncharacterized protein n=1 Tax=Olea europaea subsp. europaea TaxID=158383 RepID=A0A8S0PTU3_OLEEU|nr:Hypothetical predicted protein [Olea europaea subsp. europaea]